MALLPNHIKITGLTSDSRRVKPGMLFAALSGVVKDGAAYISDAIKNGATIIIAPTGTVLSDPGVILLESDNPRLTYAKAAAEFYPQQPATLTAVTGTNGKSSTAEFTRQLWASLGYKAASIGTLGINAGDWQSEGGLTTPEPAALHATLEQLQQQKIDHVCLEASSHGLVQNRLDGLKLTAAAFTNLTQDHLDYHHTMQAYFEAKLRLFTELLPKGSPAIINIDRLYDERLILECQKRGHRLILYGREAESLAGRTHLQIMAATPTPKGQMLALTVFGKLYHVELPLIGLFQIENALAALGLVLAGGEDNDRCVEALGQLKNVRGRLELVGTHPSGAPVYVDYAHTPDALETILRALKPHVSGKLWLIFGCGGDRDTGKRVKMGEIAARLADEIIVTDDNPRSEEPALIRQAVLAGCPSASNIGDRNLAITTAIDHLKTGDILIIAGKGHEQNQVVGDKIYPFDDCLAAQKALKALS